MRDGDDVSAWREVSERESPVGAREYRKVAGYQFNPGVSQLLSCSGRGCSGSNHYALKRRLRWTGIRPRGRPDLQPCEPERQPKNREHVQ